MTAHSRTHTEGAAGCAKQSTGAHSGVVFKRSRLQHPGLRKALRIRIPEPGEIENSGADRADYEKIMWGYVKSVGIDSADGVFEAGGWELDHSDEAWTTPSTLHCPSEPDLDACGDAGHEHGPETTEATDIEWAGSDDWAVLGFLAVDAEGSAARPDSWTGARVHVESCADERHGAGEAGLGIERDLGLCLQGFETAHADMEIQATDLLEDGEVGAPGDYLEAGRAEHLSFREAAGAAESLTVQGGGGKGGYVEAPPPVMQDGDRVCV